ncbi:MAG TPA: hypothetical protein VHQ87_11925 [Rhizobacter sp.]|nr:hypothetical protein [Rhizobacter sp.]
MTLLPAFALAAEAPVAELERQLSVEGVEKVNAYLGASGSAARVSLHHATTRCELQAVSLTVRLARDGRSKVVDAHGESLRIAVGQCTGFVLALLDVSEVPKVCASLPSWTVMQTVRELRGRMRRIDADAVLRSSPRGKACHAAYLYELQNTRVGLRTGPPHSARQPAESAPVDKANRE